ncbi:hypothetical protein AB0I84_13115 [Streptomyces spectabilis]|uniref:hypothetical protein n=1 Tax=Streptomyces spectabilis TaxID=68270 RepID=UPI0033F63C69
MRPVASGKSITPNYCAEGNFFKAGQHTLFSSWQEFTEETVFVTGDRDLNLLFRWDWCKPGHPGWDGDECLLLFFVIQCKGFNCSVQIAVTEADEPAVRAFLGDCVQAMRATWEPILDTPPPHRIRMQATPNPSPSHQEQHMTRLDPNPGSPHADADPQYRHLLPTPLFFPAPPPGALALTGCMALAVVPEDLTETSPDGELPEGLCPACVAVMRGGEPPARPVTSCRSCSKRTRHDGLCALCRQDAHEQWWPARNDVVLSASDIELEGDAMFQELAVGDPIEIKQQIGPVAPGLWVVTAVESEDRSRVRVRRLSREEIEALRGCACAQTCE